MRHTSRPTIVKPNCPCWIYVCTVQNWFVDVFACLNFERMLSLVMIYLNNIEPVHPQKVHPRFLYTIVDLFPRSRYHRHGQVITSHKYCEMWLLIPVHDACFWHTNPHLPYAIPTYTTASGCPHTFLCAKWYDSMIILRSFPDSNSIVSFIYSMCVAWSF